MTPAPDTHLTLDQAMTLAGERLKAGDLPAADALYREVLKARPDHPEALQQAAVVAGRTGRGPAAEAAARDALASRGMGAVHDLLTGNALHALGLLDQAIVLYKRAVERDPNLADAHCNMGATYKEIGWLKEAVAAYEGALRADPNHALAQSNLGVALKESGDLEGAVAAYEKAIAADPGMVQAHCNLGVALKELGRTEEAVAAYEKAIALKPDFAAALCNLGNALSALGRTSEAVAAYERTIAASPRFAQAYSNIGAIRLKEGDAQGALAMCDRFLSTHGPDARLLSLKAVALDELGRRDEVRKLVDFERLIRPVRIASPAGYADLRAFNDALADHVVRHPTMKFAPPEHATRYGHHSGELLAGSKGAVGELEAIIVDAVAGYIDDVLGDPAHPFLAHRPQLTSISAWGVVMESSGHQVSHTHPTAWLSGVYYVCLPDVVKAADAGHAGWIEFGDSGAEYAFRTVKPETKVFQPEEGKMFLFPSYLYHRTIPFEAAEKRICIAFDVW